MLGFLEVPKINADPVLEKLESGVASAKTGIAKADALLEANKLEKKHWDKLAQTEAAFQKALSNVDRIYPERKRGLANRMGHQMKILALLGALFMIGSTAFLHVWVSKND